MKNLLLFLSTVRPSGIGNKLLYSTFGMGKTIFKRLLDRFLVGQSFLLQLFFAVLIIIPTFKNNTANVLGLKHHLLNKIRLKFAQSQNYVMLLLTFPLVIKQLFTKKNTNILPSFRTLFIMRIPLVNSKSNTTKNYGEEYTSRNQLFFRFLQGYFTRFAFCFLLFLAIAQSSFAQFPLQNITCTGCTNSASTGYATAALATAGAGAGVTTFPINTVLPNQTIKFCANVTSDANGTLGIVQVIETNQPSGNTTCTPATAATRKGSLYLNNGSGGCTGTEIQAYRKGSNSSTFNNEYVGLAPNTNYVFAIELTVNSTCNYFLSSSVRYYGAVTPQFTFNCSVSSVTGTFVNGTSSNGNLTIALTGATAGATTFKVTGTGFTGSLSPTLTAGQSSVTIPITYDGTSAAGSYTLTVTSPSGGGTCSKSVTVTNPPLTASTPTAKTAITNEAKTGTASTELSPVGGNGSYVYSVDASGSCTPIVGATALPLSSNLTVTNSTTGAYTFTAPAAAGTYYYCIKVCDTSTPTPVCITKTYTLTVSLPPCSAGTTAPTLSATTKSNVCPATTADLSSLVTSSCPVGSALEWHNTNTGLSAANKVSTPASVGAGTYYPVCFDATNTCYSPVPATGVTVTITACCASGTIAPTLSATTKSNVCPATTADLSSLVTSSCPVGSSLEWHNTNTGLSAANKVSTPASVGAGTYYPVCFDATNTCYSPVPATGVTVTIATCITCIAGNSAPIISATTVTNTCPTTTFSLASLANTGTQPVGTSLVWSTHKVPTSAGDTLTNLTTVATAGKYYVLYFDKISNCYSPADSVTATLTICAVNPPDQTANNGQAKTGNASTELTPTSGTGAYVYSVDNSGSCTPVAGATALPTASNLTVTNSATGAYTYTAPTTAGVYYYCIKICDSATPTASCTTKTYTLTVTCPVGSAVPSLK